MIRGTSLALVAGTVLLIGAAVFLYGAYQLLPPYVENSVARTVQERFALERGPQVDLEPGSLTEVLAGRLSGARVTMRDVELEGVRADEVVVDLGPMDVDVLGSVLGGRIESEEPVSGTLRAKLAEEEVFRLVRAGADVPVLDLELESGSVIVDSEVTVLGLTVPVSTQGGLTLRGNELVYEPRRISALGSELPPELAEEELSKTELSYALDGLPAGARFTGVEVRENNLILNAELQRIPLGGAVGS